MKIEEKTYYISKIDGRDIAFESRQDDSYLIVTVEHKTECLSDVDQMREYGGLGFFEVDETVVKHVFVIVGGLFIQSSEEMNKYLEKIIKYGI